MPLGRTVRALTRVASVQRRAGDDLIVRKSRRCPVIVRRFASPSVTSSHGRGSVQRFRNGAELRAALPSEAPTARSRGRRFRASAILRLRYVSLDLRAEIPPLRRTASGRPRRVAEDLRRFRISQKGRERRKVGAGRIAATR